MIDTAAVKCVCGRTHRNGGVWTTSTGIQHGCRFAAVIENERWQHSAAGIKELAGRAREEGIAHWNAAQVSTPGGSRQERHLREAREAFGKAWEMEN